MPLVASAYRAPLGVLRSGHVQTVWPALFRRVRGVAYTRERLELPDGDFVDLDWLRRGQARVAVVSHGLEGDAHRPYVRGMARALFEAGWDVLAWNFRGCSGPPNRLARFYHSGATDDLDAVVQHALGQGYRRLALVGFSLGGNLTLKYVGERGEALDPRVGAALACSVPVDLAAGAAHMARPAARLYMRRFLRALQAKLQAKQHLYPAVLDTAGFEALRTFAQFDGRYTAPLHGFRDAADYWARASSGPLLPAIARPTLLLNAADDPFLPPSCFPVEMARTHPHLALEVPRHGGHVGFVLAGRTYYAERRAVAFLGRHVPS